VIDAALAAQNVVAAAESLDLGTVYIGGLRREPEKVAEDLRLPPGAFPLFGLVVGKPDPAHPGEVKPRLPQTAILHREHYQVEPEAEAVALYDQIFGEFYAAQKLPPQQWTHQSANRIKGPESLGGRARIAEAIRNLGFTIS